MKVYYTVPDKNYAKNKNTEPLLKLTPVNLLKIAEWKALRAIAR